MFDRQLKTKTVIDAETDQPVEVFETESGKLISFSGFSEEMFETIKEIKRKEAGLVDTGKYPSGTKLTVTDEATGEPVEVFVNKAGRLISLSGFSPEFIEMVKSTNQERLKSMKAGEEE